MEVGGHDRMLLRKGGEKCVVFAAPYSLQIVPATMNQNKTQEGSNRRRDNLTSVVVVALLGDPTISIYQPVSQFVIL